MEKGVPNDLFLAMTISLLITFSKVSYDEKNIAYERLQYSYFNQKFLTSFSFTTKYNTSV